MIDTGVIIPTMEDRSRLLKRAIASAELNNFREIIVVGSSDKTPSDETPNRVKYIECPNNAYTAKKRNLGINHSTSKYLMFLDDDDFYLNIPPIYKTTTPFLFSDCYSLNGGAIVKHIASPKILAESNYIPLGAVRVRSDIIKKNPFDESIKYSEDYELWLRLQHLGIPMTYSPNAFYVWDRDTSKNNKCTPNHEEEMRECINQFKKKFVINVNSIKYWDKKWDERKIAYQKHHTLFPKICGMIPPKSRVLDVGSGPGILVNKIKRSVPEVEVTALDHSGVALSMIRDDIMKVKQKLPMIPFEDSTFDITIATEVLEHMEDDAKLLSEMKRVSKKQIITVPFDCMGPEVEKEHYRTYTEKSLRKLIGEEVIITSHGNYLLIETQ